MKVEILTEEEWLRAERDQIYGPCSDNNWEACKENWRNDQLWLKKELERLLNQSSVSQCLSVSASLR